MDLNMIRRVATEAADDFRDGSPPRYNIDRNPLAIVSLYQNVRDQCALAAFTPRPEPREEGK